VTVDAQIKDDYNPYLNYSPSKNPGVYRVDVSLAKLLTAGGYTLEILLDGAEVPSPSITVEPCNNVEAFDRGFIENCGNSNWL
jgi:hypothetical protein